MRRAVSIALAALTPACALLIQIDDYVLVEADAGDAAGDVAPRDATDATDIPVDAEPDAPDAAPLACTPCAGPSSAVCGLSCNETSPTLVTLDGARVLWLASGTTVRAAPTSGSSAASTFATLPSTPVSMVATAGVLAWADSVTVRANPLDGGAPVALRASEPNVSSLAGPPPAVAPGMLFWSTTTTIRRCLISNCSTTTIDQIPSQESPTSLATGFDGQYPYGAWVNRGVATRTVQGAALIGGIVVEPLGQDPTMTAVLAIEPSGKQKVFYVTTNGAASQIWEANVGIVTSIAAPIRAMVALGSSLWVLAGDFNDPKLGRLVRYAFPGPARTDLAVGLDDPQRLAVDATSAYWTQRGSGGAKGAVFRVAR